jgi:methylisocitrate lyase
MDEAHLSPGQRLRSLLDRSCVAVPGAFNALCARAIAQAGFEACYVSGAATSVCAGVPDIGLLTLEHFCRVIREVADASGLPVIADADTGFGESEMVRRTVIEYARAGAAAMHLEDQVFPKRCGHLEGKRLIPIEHQCEKIAAAAGVIAEAPAGSPLHGFLLCARTDARGVEGIEAVVTRARAYVQAGAEMIFPEGLQGEEEFASVARALAGTPSVGGRRAGPYLLANMTEFGKTPLIRLDRFAAMGYSCVIYPVSLLRVAMGAVTRAAARLKQDGGVDGFLAEMQTRDELYRLIGYVPGVEWKYAPR